MKLLVILFLIKLYAQKNIFNVIHGKYGQNTTTLARKNEQRRLKMEKIKQDIKFLQTCKRNNLSPTFVKPKYAVKLNLKTRKRITKMIIESELTNKHKELTELQRRVKLDLAELQSTLGFISYCSLNKAINNRINRKRLAWKTTHNKKLKKLFEKVNHRTNSERPQNIVHNFSSHKLTAEEEHILSFGLDHHIPTKLNNNIIKTEFEAFYYHLNVFFSNLLWISNGKNYQEIFTDYP